MNLLAFDLATNTGWAAGDGSKLPVIGHFRLPATGHDVGRFLITARDFYGVLITRFNPDLVLFEMPVLGTVVTVAVTRKLHGMAGQLEVVCHDRGVPCREVAPATAKKQLTGSGRAKKPQMIIAARSLGLKIETEDEADAVAVWLCGVRHYSPDLWAEWDQKLIGV